MKASAGRQLTLSFPQLENEIWIAVPGWEGVYEVSNMGRFKTLVRSCNSSHGKRPTSTTGEKVRTHSSMINGYHLISFCQRPRKEARLAHRVVAIAFIPNPENKPEVNHLDGDKSNNAASNLAWSTEIENMQHAVDTGLKVFRWKRKPLAAGNVLEIFASPLSLGKLSAAYCIPKLTVHAIKAGKRYSKITGKSYLGKMR